jgi:hypothetical protein
VRRRSAAVRLAGFTFGVTALCVSGCSGGSHPAPLSHVHAETDARSGKIVMPVDKYQFTRDEDAEFTTANDLAVSRCMKNAGQGQFFPFIDRRHPVVAVDWRYGVWVKSQVARYGYQRLPQTDREKKLLQYNGIKLTPAAQVTYQHCISVVQQLGLRLPVPDDDEFSNGGVAVKSVTDTAAGRAVIAAWVKCLTDQGVSAPTVPQGTDWFPRGITDAPLQEQIRVGLIDVDCKEKLGTIQRLADIDAQQEESWVEAHEAQLVEQRQQYQATLDRARRYLSGAPELLNS